MKKHRGLWLGLGLAALLSLAAGEAQAATMTLTVYLDGTSIYGKTGTDTAVTADTTTLNSNLNGTGYTFTNLGGSSNSPGTATSDVGGYITQTGDVSFTSGGTGGTLMIVVTEGGFTAPASGTGNTLQSTGTATFNGATTSSTQTVLSNFTDSGSVNVNAPLITQTASTTAAQSATTTASLGSYVTPYTLTNTTTITLGALHSSSPGTDSFTATTSVLAAVPEPASLIMMVTGMPLPLVVMGLLRRRRAAA